MTLQVQENYRNDVACSFSEEQLNLIKNHICKGANDDELRYFLQVCKKTRLDPFSKQIYSIPRGGQRTIQVSIDGLRLIADRTGRYMPGRESTYTYDKNGNLESATAYVKKLAKDGSWHECANTAYWNEYNAAQGLWKKMPRVMLAKCAEASCLRKCFPGEMTGLYAEDEMDQADNPNVQPLYIKQNPQVQIEVKPDIQTPSLDLVTKDQSLELKNIHELCDPVYKDNVIKQLAIHGINGWSKVPTKMYQTLFDDANNNALKFQMGTTKEDIDDQAG